MTKQERRSTLSRLRQFDRSPSVGAAAARRQSTVRVAAAEHDWAQVELILIDETRLPQASRKFWPANVNAAVEIGFRAN